MRTSWENYFEDVIIDRFNDLKKRNHRTSVRLFAKMSKVSASSMSQILSRNERWSLTRERAYETLINAKVESEKINRFSMLTSTPWIDDGTALSPHDLFFSNPYYIPTLLSFGLVPPPSTVRLSEVLKISTAQVEKIIDDLVKTGHLTMSAESTLVQNASRKLKTGDGPRNEILMKLHLANFDMIRESLIRDSATERDVTSLTLTGDAAQVEEVKKEIRQFHQRIHSILNHSGKQNEVFKLVVGFMPLKFNNSQMDSAKAPQ
jgi:polyhydroxyalkanoate synthesis regulator phasin